MIRNLTEAMDYLKELQEMAEKLEYQCHDVFEAIDELKDFLEPKLEAIQKRQQTRNKKLKVQKH